MEKGISYLNRTYSDYKQALIEYSKKYFPDFNVTYDDASVASWLIGLNAAIADDLSYHIDRVYQETNIDSANERASLFNIARNNGVKIPGPKGAMAEVKFSCVLPADNSGPNYGFAPIIKRGTKVASTTQTFEVMEDVDFKSQFNSNNVSDRTVVPNVDTNGDITGYTVSKLTVVVAGDTRIYRQSITSSSIKPFMEVILPVQDVMSIESVIVGTGIYTKSVPSFGEFYSETELCKTDDGKSRKVRFFEVDNLAQPERWGDSIDDYTKKALTCEYSNGGNVVYSVTKGEWKPVEHKFITEYTDNGYIKLIFGSGVENGGSNATIPTGMSEFAKWQISRIMNNEALGVLPDPNSTMFVLYRVGGGASSNVAAGAINRIASMDIQFREGEGANAGDFTKYTNLIKSTMSVTNTTPSVSGKDMPSNAELRYLIKYHNAAQERCVTVKDYIDRILNLPPRYGTPFRVGVAEENNKIAIYLLGINHLGQLDAVVPDTLVKNIERYLERYRMINDFVEIKPGRVINLGFEIDAIIDKNYNATDVVRGMIEAVTSYMDINKHLMGEEIFVGDLEKEISKVDGVINLIDLRVKVKRGSGYSQDPIAQATMIDAGDNDADNDEYVDLEASDGILYNDGDTMMEIKYPKTDIQVKIKER